MGEGVYMQGGLPNIAEPPSKELGKQTVRILLECFLVLIFFVI